MIMLSSPSIFYLDSGILQQTAAHVRQEGLKCFVAWTKVLDKKSTAYHQLPFAKTLNSWRSAPPKIDGYLDLREQQWKKDSGHPKKSFALLVVSGGRKINQLDMVWLKHGQAWMILCFCSVGKQNTFILANQYCVFLFSVLRLMSLEFYQRTFFWED